MALTFSIPLTSIFGPTVAGVAVSVLLFLVLSSKKPPHWGIQCMLVSITFLKCYLVEHCSQWGCQRSEIIWTTSIYHDLSSVRPMVKPRAVNDDDDSTTMNSESFSSALNGFNCNKIFSSCSVLNLLSTSSTIIDTVMPRYTVTHTANYICLKL